MQSHAQHILMRRQPHDLPECTQEMTGAHAGSARRHLQAEFFARLTQ